MTVTAPPREPEIEPGDLERRVAELEAQAEQALIEEARRRARRRRRRNGAAVLLVAAAGVAAFMGFGGHGGGGAGVNAAFAVGSSAEGRAQTPTPAPSLAALPADARPWGFAFDAGSPDTVYVTSAHAGRTTHIYKTIDGGRHWQPTGARGAKWASDILALTADPVISGTLYVGTDTAVYKSVDGGRSWRPFSEGLFRGPGDLVCAPLDQSPCAGRPYHFGTPGETNWARNAGWVLDVAVDPADNKVVYAAAEEVRKSTDGGHTWKAMHLPPSKNWYSPAKIAIAPTRPESIYTIAHSNQLLDSTAIYKSTDAGIHWQATGGPNPDFPKSGSWDSTDALVVDPQHPAILYAAIGGVVIKTTDGGDHWHHVTNGLPPGDASSRLSGLPEDGNVTSLAADPQHPGVLYAGLQRGPEKGAIYKTTDGGSSWTPLVATDGRIAAVEIPSADTPTIWAVGWAGGRTKNGEQTWKPQIYRSTDGGDTWVSAP